MPIKTKIKGKRATNRWEKICRLCEHYKASTSLKFLHAHYCGLYIKEKWGSFGRVILLDTLPQELRKKFKSRPLPLNCPYMLEQMVLNTKKKWK